MAKKKQKSYRNWNSKKPNGSKWKNVVKQNGAKDDDDDENVS